MIGTGEDIARFEHSKLLFLDTETTGLGVYKGDRICGISLLGDDLAGPRAYFPLRHAGGPNLSEHERHALFDLIARSRCIGWNSIGFDAKMLWNEGVEFAQPMLDVMIGLHLADENRRSFALKTTAENLWPGSAAEERKLAAALQARMLSSKADIWRLPPGEAAPYAVDDVVLTARICWEHIVPLLAREGTLQLWQSVCRYAELISAAEYRGVLIDETLARKLSTESQQNCIRVYSEVRRIAKRRVNLDAPAQVAKWLGVERTDRDVLERLGTHEADLVREFRDWSKVDGSYYRPFLKDNVEGVIHPSFNMIGTVTGRLSCREPNLQAIPRYTARQRVKECIIARPGFEFVQADYSQAELRVASHYARELSMAAVLRAGGDVHQAVADELRISRSDAKRINFSIVYGIGAWSLAGRLKVEMPVAEDYLGRFHERYPGFRRLLRDYERTAMKYKKIKLYTGRIRHFNLGPEFTPYRTASSCLVQGTVGEVLREHHTRLGHELSTQFGCHQLLQVHDSVVFESPIEHRHEVVKATREIMEDHALFSVPMTIDVKVGSSLHNLEAA